MPTGGSRQTSHDLRDAVTRLLERHRVLTSLASRQQTPRHTLLEQMQHRQNLVELQRHLKLQHPADIATILDSLPSDESAAGLSAARPRTGRSRACRGERRRPRLVD